MVKYHKTLTTYVNGLLQNGFELLELVEPQPEPGLLEAYPEIMQDELRRPMMLIVSARKRCPHLPVPERPCCACFSAVSLIR